MVITKKKCFINNIRKISAFPTTRFFFSYISDNKYHISIFPPLILGDPEVTTKISNILQITQPSQSWYAKLQYRFAVTSQSPSILIYTPDIFSSSYLNWSITSEASYCRPCLGFTLITSVEKKPWCYGLVFDDIRIWQLKKLPDPDPGSEKRIYILRHTKNWDSEKLIRIINLKDPPEHLV